MKELFGRPLNLTDNLYTAFGFDYLWWFIPTQPCISINYLERMYTVKEIKKLREFEEEDYDEDRKIFAQTILRSRREKQVFVGLILFFITLWMVYFRYRSLEWQRGEPIKWDPYS